MHLNWSPWATGLPTRYQLSPQAPNAEDSAGWELRHASENSKGAALAARRIVSNFRDRRAFHWPRQSCTATSAICDMACHMASGCLFLPITRQTLGIKVLLGTRHQAAWTIGVPRWGRPPKMRSSVGPASGGARESSYIVCVPENSARVTQPPPHPAVTATALAARYKTAYSYYRCSPWRMAARCS